MAKPGPNLWALLAAWGFKSLWFLADGSIAFCCSLYFWPT